MLGGSQAGYARMTRRWWRPVRARWRSRASATGPCTSCPPTRTRWSTSSRRRRAPGEAEIVRFVEQHGPDYLREELERFREGRGGGLVGELPLLRRAPAVGVAARGGRGVAASARRPSTRLGVTHISSRAALRVSAQVIALDKLDPGRARPAARARSTPSGSRGSNAVIVNIEYPLGLAAYNILRELTTVDRRRARRLRARQGGDAERRRRRRADLRRHPRRALGLDLLARQRVLVRRHRAVPALRQRARQPARGDGQEHVPAEPRVPRLLLPRGLHGGGDGGRAVLQRGLRDRRRRPLPVGEAVNFSKLPIDFGIIHYASDTPYTQARTLGARGLSYYGMDSTYASSLAILRRIFKLEGVLNG